MGRSRGGLTTKIHACVDPNGMPVRLELTTGEAHDSRLVTELLSIYNQARCCWLIEGTTQTGLEHSPVTEVRGLTFLRSEIAKTQSVLARICIRHAIWWSASSIRSSNAGASPPDMINWPQTTLPFIKLAAIRIWLRAYESTP